MAARKTLNWFFLGRLTSSAIWIAGPTHSSSPFAPITAHKKTNSLPMPLVFLNKEAVNSCYSLVLGQLVPPFY